MTKRTGFFFDEHCLWHSAGAHALIMPVGGWVQPPAAGGLAESPESKRRLKNLMDVSGLTAALDVRSAPAASNETLQRVHPPEYLARFKKLSDAGGGEFGDNAPIGPGSYEIAARSAGLAQAAVEAVLSGELDNAYALSRPPGHHCLPDHAMGFCFLANIAIAIESAKARLDVPRVAVVDWDVHHANGTQHIFYERNDVFTISIHQQGCFPPGYLGEDERGAGPGEGSNLNIPLAPGAGSDAYLHAMDTLVRPALNEFAPDLIIVACGYDANAFDPLARMLLPSETFRQMTQRMRDAAQALCEDRLVLIHEGGYSEAYVPFCGHAAIEALAGVGTDVVDPLADLVAAQQPIGETQTFHRQVVDRLVARQNNSKESEEKT